MKKLLTILAFIAFTISSQAQEKSLIQLPKWAKDIKFSGYGQLQYQYDNSEGGKHNEFNLRLLRMSLDGKISDFDWRVQMQGTSAKGPGEPTVMLVDLYTEWSRYKEIRIRVGQFKRPFTFENPTHPITNGWYSYALVTNNLSGFGDRTGEKASTGRDIGLQLQGDLFPSAKGHRFLHYQVGVFNGEGINSREKDWKKDFIGGLWVVPIPGVRIGAFGWTGTRGEMNATYTGIDSLTNMPVTKTTTLESVRKKRYALSAEYDKDEWTFRAEYIYSYGMGANLDLGNKADGWYVSAIVPAIKQKLHAKARYQTYRDNKEWNRSKSMYEVGLNYFFNKNLQLNCEYAYVNDRTLNRHSYNMVDLQLDFRF